MMVALGPWLASVLYLWRCGHSMWLGLMILGEVGMLKRIKQLDTKKQNQSASQVPAGRL